MWIVFVSVVTATVLILPTEGTNGCCFWQKGKKEDKETSAPVTAIALTRAGAHDDRYKGVDRSQGIENRQTVAHSRGVDRSQSQSVARSNSVDLKENSDDASEVHIADDVHITWLVRFGWKQGGEEGHICTGVLADIGSEFKGKIVVTTAGCINSMELSVNTATAMLEQRAWPVTITNMFGCEEAKTPEGRYDFNIGLVFLAGRFTHRVSLSDRTTQVPPGADLRTADWVHRDVFIRQGKTPPGASAQAPEEFIMAEIPIAVGVREGTVAWNHPIIDVTDSNYLTSTIKFGASSGAPAIMRNGADEVVVALYSRVGAGGVRKYVNLKYYRGILENMVAQGEKITRTGKVQEGVKTRFLDCAKN